MNPETQKKHRFNIIDLVLILAVLACAAGMIIRSNVRETVLLNNEEKASVTILIEALLDDSTLAMHEGDTFYFSSNDETFGTMKTMELSPAKLRFFNSDGTVTITHYENRKDAVCTFEVSGFNTDTGFMINGNTFMGCGGTFNLHSKYIELQCTVLDVVPQT